MPVFAGLKPDEAQKASEADEGGVPDKIPSIGEIPKQRPKPRPAQKSSPRIEVSAPDEDLNNVVSTVLNGFSENYGQKTEEAESADSTSIGQSFFKRFEEFISDQKYDEKIMGMLHSNNLFDKMKSYHECRKKGTPFVFDEKDITHMFSGKLKELKHLEKEWEDAGKKLDSYSTLLLQKENEIRGRIQELKEVICHFKKVRKNDLIEASLPLYVEQGIVKDPEHYFRTGGAELKSLKELYVALHNMDDSQFSHHVNSQKNDFSAWLNEIFQEPLLAKKIQQASTREEILSILKDAV